MKRRRSDEPLHETAAEWLERVGYCFHRPLCSDSAVCRAKRAKERAASTTPRVYTGEPKTSRKLDWEDE